MLVNAGLEVTAREMTQEKGFWEAECASASLLKSIMSWLSMERIEGDREDQPISDHSDWKTRFSNLPPSAGQSVHRPFLTWVEMWPWLRRSYVGRAIAFLRQYFDITNPVVIVCYRADIFSVIISRFADATLLRSEQPFLPYVGELQVVPYGDHPENYTVLLPAFHPGYDGCGDQPTEFRRILHITLWIAMLTTKIATQLISKESLVSRSTLCRRVKTDVDTILHDLGISDLLKTEKESFANLLKGVKISARNLAEAKKLHLRKHLLLDRTVACGVSKTKPGSEERKKEVKALFDSLIPDLHIHISRSNEAQWMDWALNEVGEGGLWFHRALERAPQSLLAKIIGPWNRKTSNTSSPRENLDILSDLDVAVYEWNGLMTQKQKNALRWYKAFEAEEHLHEHEIKVTSAGHVYLPTKIDGHKVTIVLGVGNSQHELAPRNENDLRYVLFSSEGIDVQNDKGKSLLPYATIRDERATITFDLPQLVLTDLTAKVTDFSFTDAQLKSRLVSLWEQETGESYIQQMLPQIHRRRLAKNEHLKPEPLISFGSSKHRRLFQRSWNTRANEGYKPQKGDPAWLLKEFLDDWCPDGGTINVGLARFWGEDENNIWSPLLDFFCREEYDDYPYILLLRAVAKREDANMIRAIWRTVGKLLAGERPGGGDQAIREGRFCTKFVAGITRFFKNRRRPRSTLVIASSFE